MYSMALLRALVIGWMIHVQFREDTVQRSEGAARYREDDPGGCGGLRD